MPRPFYPWERPGAHFIGGWAGPRVGLDRCEKFRPTEIRSPGRPARGQPLYRLSYSGPREGGGRGVIFDTVPAFLVT